MDLFSFDRTYYQKGVRALAGIDEAGRGPWAGPVVAAAVILPPDASLPGINDSKKLTPKKREELFPLIHATARAVGVGIVAHDRIDSLNILEATYAAMRGALTQLSAPADLVLVDGCWTIPGIPFAQEPLVGGDGRSAAIAAASVIAKVTRDRLMTELAKEYPQYSFDKHKGYGTAEHLEALRRYGPCPIHRKSFAPVHRFFEKAT
jgi:ribonuclease HII